MKDSGEPKFLADSMLGKLARWLILLGYDASYAATRGEPDLDILDRAQREGRVFLTQDTKIPEVASLRKIVLRQSRLEEQLVFVLRELGLKPDPARLFTRCTYCNQPLLKLAREEALPEAPPLVRQLQTDFFRCPSCRRLYWTGSHTSRTIEKLRRLGL